MERSPRRLLNALVRPGGLAATIFAIGPSRTGIFGEADPPAQKATGASEKLISRRPALGLSVAQPNPSVANLISGTIAAGRYKQMTTSQKKGDVSVAIL